MEKATEIFEKHWTKATGKPLDEATKHHMKYAIEAINEALSQPPVIGSLPMYDVDELNEIIKLFNNKEIDLYTCIGRVWNKAYFIGANEGMKAGQLGNDR